MTTEISDEEVIAQVVGRLQEKFPAASPDDISGIVREEFSALAGRPVEDYLSVLTERAAKKRLKESAKQ